MAEMLAGMMAALQSGKTPDGNSFQDCFVRSLLALLDEYVKNDTPFTEELDRLVVAFRNRKDPFVASLGLMEHTAASSMLNTIRVEREKRREREREKGTA